MMRIANLIFHSPASITTHLANLHTVILPSATSQAATLTDAHRPPHMVGSGRTGEAAACIIRMHRHTQLSRRLSSTLAPNIPLTQLSIRLVHIAKLPSSYGSSALPGDVEGVVKALPTHTEQATPFYVKLVAPCTGAPPAAPPKSAPVALKTGRRLSTIPSPLSKAQKHKSSHRVCAGSARLDRSSTLEAVKPDEGCPRPPHPLSCTPRNQPHPQVFHTLHPARAVSLEPLKKT